MARFPPFAFKIKKFQFDHQIRHTRLLKFKVHKLTTLQ
jgi:hypothetical protein